MEKTKRVYTLGYEGRKLHTIRSILRENRITHLIDIRRKNEGKKSPFNKFRMQDICREAGAGYFHEPDLAPSVALLRERNQRKKAIQEEFPGKDWASRLSRKQAMLDYAEHKFREKYLAELDQRKVCGFVVDLVNQTERPCFFSQEKHNKLYLSNRKMLLDHCLHQCALNVKPIHLREWFYHTGQFHDLRKAFDRINKIQFDNQLNKNEVAFSWYSGLQSGPGRFIFGQFRAPNLVLINEKLDLGVVPEFMIHAIFYHELIHYVRYRDGLDHRHTVAFYIDELNFEEAGKAYLWDRDFWNAHLPQIQEELELAKIEVDETDPSLKPLFDYIDAIMTGKAKQDGNDQEHD